MGVAIRASQEECNGTKKDLTPTRQLRDPFAVMREQFYRCEGEHGSFYRAVPLPEGVRLEDVKATFADVCSK
jgi:hypothetical protein